MPYPRTAGLVALSAFAAIAFVCGCGTQNSEDGSPLPAMFSGSSNGGSDAAGDDLPSNPTLLEQLMLERINRARLRPGAEAADNGIAIDEGVLGQLDADPRQAVALNPSLSGAAANHALDMLANDFFAHENLRGETPFDRMSDMGYRFSTAGENLAWRGTTGPVNEVEMVETMHLDLFVDTTVPGRGHRLVMLNPAFREVGVSIRRGAFSNEDATFDSLMAVQDYATANRPRTFFVLGVVYDDRNRNGQYDIGEGRANRQVALDDFTSLTTTGGGFTFEVVPGTYTIFFEGAEHDLDVVDKNVKVDFVNGARIDVNLGLGQF